MLKKIDALANQYEIGANLSGIVMKVSPEDKKVVLYKEELLVLEIELANVRSNNI